MKRKALLNLIGLIAILVLIVGGCATKEHTLPPDPPEPSSVPTQVENSMAIQEVVVRGIRGSLSESIDTKRLGALTVDSITAEGIDRLHDSVSIPIASVEELWIIATVNSQSNVDEDEGPGSGSLVVHRSKGPSDDEIETVPLPLKHTSVKAAIHGYVGSVDVSQQFENPFDEKIEAVYLFPLPQNAAVNEFIMTIGERRIRGILREKEQAEEIYQQARAQGYQASLLVQHRPNVFEQKVANIEPGKRIDIELRYFHTLAHHDGWYSFVFPTVIGPRYNPISTPNPIRPVPVDRLTLQPEGTSAPFLGPGQRSAHDIDIEVSIDAGVTIEALTASHPIERRASGRTSIEIALAEQSVIPNQDFVLKFQVAGGEVKSNMMTYVDSETDQGYFTMMLYPPAQLEDLSRQPMEMVFVLDCSGSMRDVPLRQAKNAIIAALDLLEPSDTFQIIRFSSDASHFGASPVAATPAKIRSAKAYVQGLSGSGGTEMLAGVRAALDFPHDPQRLRFVTFLTDGYIGNEVEILANIQQRLGAARIFSFGVGDSVNRYLMERMAKIGKGAVAYLSSDDSGAQIMADFFERISHPALTDMQIDWGQMQVSDVYPSRVPDLFVGRPVIIAGKFTGTLDEPIIQGNAGGYQRLMTVANGETIDGYNFIPKLWARSRIADLSDRMAGLADPSEDFASKIKDTALTYGLMSHYTAFIAVDASYQTEGAQGTVVHQAVPVPKGVKYSTTVR